MRCSFFENTEEQPERLCNASLGLHLVISELKAPQWEVQCTPKSDAVRCDADQRNLLNTYFTWQRVATVIELLHQSLAIFDVGGCHSNINMATKVSFNSSKKRSWKTLPLIFPRTSAIAARRKSVYYANFYQLQSDWHAIISVVYAEKWRNHLGSHLSRLCIMQWRGSLKSYWLRCSTKHCYAAKCIVLCQLTVADDVYQWSSPVYYKQTPKYVCTSIGERITVISRFEEYWVDAVKECLLLNWYIS